MYRRRKNQQYRILTKISKELEKALKVENLAMEAMEDAEAVWKFEAMFSGEAYQEDGEWKRRE
ncbi:Protein CBG07791 [Caenorhabditis briggsae]|nr:Protein CBG07791 [Caenorhabditis briggsae]CAP27389.1 Protein CBG07791 [Caenorhabditis briggsae]